MTVIESIGLTYLLIGASVVFRAYRDDSLNITSGSWPTIKDEIDGSLYFANDKSQILDYVMAALPLALMWPAFIYMVSMAFWRKRRLR